MKKIIFIIILIGFVICLSYFDFISIGSSGCGTSSGSMMGSSRGNMMRSGVIMWIVIIILIIILFDGGNSNRKSKNHQKNIDKLDDRLVNGEISIEEYNEIRNKLGK